MSRLVADKGLSIGLEDVSLQGGCLSLNDVSLTDSTGKTLLWVRRVDADMRWRSLLLGRIKADAVRLVGPEVYLERETPGSPLSVSALFNGNLADKIDISGETAGTGSGQTAREDSGKTAPDAVRRKRFPSVELNSVLIYDGRLHYDVLSEPTLQGIDFNHLEIEQLHMLASGRTTAAGALGLQVEQLTFSDRSGFELSSARLATAYDGRQLVLYGMDVQLPRSALTADTAKLYLPAWAADSLDIIYPLQLDGHISVADFPGLDRRLRLDASQCCRLELAVSVTGNHEDINVQNIRLSVDDLAAVQGNVWINRPFDSPAVESYWRRIYVTPAFYRMAGNAATGRDTEIPDWLQALEYASYEGYLTATSGQLGADGELETALGVLSLGGTVDYDSLSADKRFEAEVETSSLQLQPLAALTGLDMGRARMDVRVSGTLPAQGLPQLEAQATVGHLEINGYDYQDVRLEGLMAQDGSCRLSMDSRDGNFTTMAQARLGGLADSVKTLQCSVQVEHINPQIINLLEGEDPQAHLSFALTADLSTSPSVPLSGQLGLDSLALFNRHVWYTVDSLRFEAAQEHGENRMSIASDALSGELRGDFHPRGLVADLRNRVLDAYLPALGLADSQAPTSDNRYSFHLDLNPTDALSEALGLPVSVPSTAHIEGDYDDEKGRIRLEMQAGEAVLDGRHLYSPTLRLWNGGSDKLSVQMSAEYQPTETVFMYSLEATAADDNIDLALYWDNYSDDARDGKLSVQSHLERPCPTDALGVSARLNSSDLWLLTGLWSLEPFDVQWDGRRLALQGFDMHRGGQSVRAHGLVSPAETDSLAFDLRDVSLDDVFDLVALNAMQRRAKAKPVRLTGLFSGQGTAVSLLATPRIDADVRVKDFGLCYHVMGDLQGKARWNEQIQGIELKASTYEDTLSTCDIDGLYRFSDHMLELDLQTHGIPADFVSYFANPVDVKARSYGDIRVVCATDRNFVQVTGTPFADQGTVVIIPFNASFAFADTVHMTADRLWFNNTLLTDSEGHHAWLDGGFGHQNFLDMRYDATLSLENAKMLDLSRQASSGMYGTAYVSGTVSAQGTDQDMTLDINARTDDRTHLTVTTVSGTASGHEDFIHFVSSQPQDSVAADSVSAPVILPKSNRLTLNAQVDIRPTAELSVVLNEASGDGVSVRGQGSLRLASNPDETNVYGHYELESGKYEFNFQDLLKRDFIITPGSSVNFLGDPMASTLDIGATYSVINVSLTDLLDEADIASLNLTRTSIPVNCTMRISGELRQPEIVLGLSFPNADEELQRRIMNVINTDEMLNRQIVYLLLLNQFAVTDNSSANTANSNMSAVVGVTLNSLSNQLNRMIYQVLGSDNLSLGFNYRNSEVAEGGLGEWQVALTSQLMDNRLVVNGNIGSREDLVNENTQFIGDFDLEYKFSSSGRWRLKMFNRSNDSRYFKSAMTTQGVGVVYKESFSTLSELKQSYVERIVRQIVQSNAQSDIRKKRDQ